MCHALWSWYDRDIYHLGLLLYLYFSILLYIWTSPITHVRHTRYTHKNDKSIQQFSIVTFNVSMCGCIVVHSFCHFPCFFVQYVRPSRLYQLKRQLLAQMVCMGVCVCAFVGFLIIHHSGFRFCKHLMWLSQNESFYVSFERNLCAFFFVHF